MSNSLLSIKEQLDQIIDEEKIIPVYQPIFSLKNGELLGYEALSRIALDSSLQAMCNSKAFGLLHRGLAPYN